MPTSRRNWRTWRSLLPRKPATLAALTRTKETAARSPQPFSSSAAKGGTGRITIDLYEQARPFKAACAAEGLKMSDVIRELVAKWTEAHTQK